MFYGLFLATKTKYCLTIVIFGIVQEHETFIEFNDSERLLDRCQNIELIEVKIIPPFLPKSSKKSFNGGIFIST